MAHVYEARHSELDRRVALKVMQPALAAQPSAAARFLREAKAACHIRHQHVVEVFDIGTEHGFPYIVMEFLEGSNLAALLADKGPLPLVGVTNLFLPVISAVATAHTAGVIHRDLKPANLMLTQRPPRGAHPMVLDFGISKIANDELESTLTRSESLLGTVQYMAPELTRGAKFASPASDQYALGVMLYECATGQRPFNGPSHYELMHAIVTGPVVPPSQIRPELPPEFDALVEKAMHRDPAKRFPSVHALGGALLAFGDRAAWALWESEFLGTARDVDLWGADGGTLHNAPNGARAPTRSMRRIGAARWRVARIGFLPLVVYAATTTVMLARRGNQVNPADTDARPSVSRLAADPAAPPATPVAMRSSEEISGLSNPSPLPERPRTLERAAEDPRATAAAQMLGSSGGSKEAMPPVVPAPLAKKGRPTPVRLAPSSQAPSAPPPVKQPPPSVHEGTNGAPIVD